MADIVIMPKLGFDMAEGTLVRWVVQEGEPVSKGAVLAEIETDKATVEVESGFGGVVARHLVPEGEVVPVNKPIAVIAASGERIDYQSLLGEALTEKAAKKGAAVAEPKVEQEDKGEVSAPAKPVQLEDEGSQPSGRVIASPLARRMAEEQGIELKNVMGTGPGGRITKKDIEKYPKAGIAAKPAPAALVPSEAPAGEKERLPAPALSIEPARETQTIQLNRLRAAIGRRMTEAKQQVPHFYVTHEYDMASVMELRQQVNALLPEEQKTSVNDFIIRAVALTLIEFPNLNASLSGDQIVRHGQINVGVAVAVEGGLLTVVCKDADRKPVRIISSEVKAMVSRAREGKVRSDDIEGSTFSVSNLGMYDVEHFIAIINPPEAAILAIGSAREVPVVKNGQITVGMRMKATISVDHRVSDGAEAARFLHALTQYLEEPMRLMI
jgi:pyruvate dehydrogenase E2 component (dihydrolipoamide acetyltransferase)